MLVSSNWRVNGMIVSSMLFQVVSEFSYLKICKASTSTSTRAEKKHTMWCRRESVFCSGMIDGVWEPWLCPPWPWWPSMHTHQQSWGFSVENSIPSALIISSVKPTQPMTRTKKGSSILSMWTKRSIDWRNTESARARRKTPLKNAPMEQGWNGFFVSEFDFGGDESLPTSSARWNANVNLTVWK